ncbi:hypothetical protein HDZ31DRAFT_46769 [Schizophyllum fasciatum]
MSAPPPPQAGPFSRSDIEIANRAADGFVRVYYAAYDSDTRATDVPKFYRQDSTLTWNGTALQGAEGMHQLLQGMPPTVHEMQSFDCHPVPGTSPPQLLITVSGNVTHGAGPTGNPKGSNPKDPEGHPRVFCQTFMLVVDPTAPPSKPGEMAKYYVCADSFRFVG